jgi:hypothetical protein
MRHDGGNALKSQDNGEGLKALPLKSMECGKFCPAFEQIIDAAAVIRVPLPPRSPDLNAYAEWAVHSIKGEGLSRSFCLGKRRSAPGASRSNPVSWTPWGLLKDYMRKAA